MTPAEAVGRGMVAVAVALAIAGCSSGSRPYDYTYVPSYSERLAALRDQLLAEAAEIERSRLGRVYAPAPPGPAPAKIVPVGSAEIRTVDGAPVMAGGTYVLKATREARQRHDHVEVAPGRYTLAVGVHRERLQDDRLVSSTSDVALELVPQVEPGVYLVQILDYTDPAGQARWWPVMTRRGRIVASPFRPILGLTPERAIPRLEGKAAAQPGPEPDAERVPLLVRLWIRDAGIRAFPRSDRLYRAHHSHRDLVEELPASVLVPPPGTPPEAERYYQDARDLYRARKHVEALAELDVAIERHRGLDAAQVYKGLIALELGRFEEALRWLAAPGAQPHDAGWSAWVGIHKAQALWSLERWDEALAELDRLVALGFPRLAYPIRARVHCDRASAAHRERRRADLVRDLDRALADLDQATRPALLNSLPAEARQRWLKEWQSLAEHVSDRYWHADVFGKLGTKAQACHAAAIACRLGGRCDGARARSCQQ